MASNNHTIHFTRHSSSKIWLCPQEAYMTIENGKIYVVDKNKTNIFLWKVTSQDDLISVCIWRHSRKVKLQMSPYLETPQGHKGKISPIPLLCSLSLFFTFPGRDLFTFQGNNPRELFPLFLWGHFSVMIRTLSFFGGENGHVTSSSV